MIRKILILSIVFIMALTALSHTSHVKIIYTTDVHGCFFPTDFITRQPTSGSLARVYTAVDSLRQSFGNDHIVLLDNGDILQGQPAAYYYNFIDTTSTHITSEIFDFMAYDAASVGNHDIETGHAVYDRWRASTRTPLLAANVIDCYTGFPYFQPYITLYRDGLKIAVLGMISPAIPAWLPENLWTGLRFDDIESSAKYWLEVIRKNENPDIIIGLFHSGHDASKMTGGYIENASMLVAKNTPGFDAILMGHDHQQHLSYITHHDNHKTCVINPANNAQAIGIIDITTTRQPDGVISDKVIEGSIMDISHLEPSQAFMTLFAKQSNDIMNFVSRPLGNVTDSLHTRDAFFGASSFMTLLHDLQLEISGADISFAAPLSFDATIAKGTLHVSDMFTLYKYENMLYTMRLTGLEIKNYLEESYALWTNQISSDQPHLINFASDNPSPSDNRLRHPTYNFDSAAGIIYTVDVTKPKGKKITIISMYDGTPFLFDRNYSVAINSYRANGGGNLLTDGAGIPIKELKSRIISATENDLRYYLLKAVEQRGIITPRVDKNWHFIPTDIASSAINVDRQILFSPESSKNQK